MFQSLEFLLYKMETIILYTSQDYEDPMTSGV